MRHAFSHAASATSARRFTAHEGCLLIIALTREPERARNGCAHAPTYRSPSGMDTEERAALWFSLAQAVPWASWLSVPEATAVDAAAAGGRQSWAAFLDTGPAEVVAAAQGVLGELILEEVRRRDEAASRNAVDAAAASGGELLGCLWPRADDVYHSVEWDVEDWAECPPAVTARALPVVGTVVASEDSPTGAAVTYVTSETARATVLHAHMQEILQQLRNCQPHCAPFMRPVRRSEAPDYYDIITNPSDLQTIAATVAAAGYSEDPAQFGRDVLRIYTNCREYNTEPANEYVASADIMERMTRQLLAEIPMVLVGRLPEIGFHGVF